MDIASNYTPHPHSTAYAMETINANANKAPFTKLDAYLDNLAAVATSDRLL